MSTKERNVLQAVLVDRDLEAITSAADPDLREAIVCSITNHRRPDTLAVGDPVPPLALVSLEDGRARKLNPGDGRPVVLIFGSYT